MIHIVHCTRQILFTSPTMLSELTLWLILSIAPTMVPIVLTSLGKEFHSGNYKLLRFIPMVLLLHRVTAPCLHHTLLCNRRSTEGWMGGIVLGIAIIWHSIVLCIVAMLSRK